MSYDVSAVLVTRGDVLLQPILKSLPPEWEVVIWNNGLRRVAVPPKGSRNVYDDKWMKPIDDLSVFGRYAAIKYASGELIYVQDDDVIVSDPHVLADEWWRQSAAVQDKRWPGIVCNMPPEFRPHYTGHALVGFGAAFQRDVPSAALRWFAEKTPGLDAMLDQFNRCCDVVVTGLSPLVLVDVLRENLPYASDDNRMWKQPNHVSERAQMLALVNELKGE